MLMLIGFSHVIAPPLLHVHVAYRSTCHRAGGVDHNIHFAECGDGFLEKALDV